MKNHGKKIAVILMAMIFFSVSACMKTKQARSVEAKSIIVDRSILKEYGGDKALLLYKKQKTDSPVYSAVMIDPVLIFKPKDASPEEIADLQKLASNFTAYLNMELGKDFRIVKEPEPDTLRIQTAILDAESSNRFTDTMSTIMPYSIGFSIIKNFVTGKPSGVGEITAEMKFTDAMTNELLGAAVDRRVGGKGIDGLFDTWNDANAGMEYWAKRIRYVMCLDLKKKNCEEPGNY